VTPFEEEVKPLVVDTTPTNLKLANTPTLVECVTNLPEEV
jgi:hypothetical protein